MSAPASAEDARRRGRRMLGAAVAFVVAFAVLSGAWIAWKAAENPDVQTRRPRWLDPAAGFDHAFWAPLLVTVGVGAALVLAVFWRAARRLAAGEDLYAGRYGRGLRRRGERFVEDSTSPSASAPRKEAER